MNKICTLARSGYHDKGMYGELPLSPCVFAACDSSYFMEHATSFIYSAGIAGKDVHIHVINPTRQVFSLASILNSVVETNVTYTFNEATLPKDEEQRRTLYACLRFITLPQILRSAKKVLTLDIDCMVMCPFDFPDKPAGYFPRQSIERGGSVDTHSVAAGAVYFTEKTLKYADQVDSCVRDTPLQWFADQVALNKVFQNIPKDLVDSFDNNFMDWEFKDGTIIWTGKGARKYDNHIYVSKKREMYDLVSKKLDSHKNVVLKPRLDIPFKQFGIMTKGSINEPIRKHWANFVDKICKTLDSPLVIEMPRWMFNNKLLSYFPEDIPMFVPHEERQSWGGNKSTKYYMQTVFPWLFTVDSQGWGGGADFINTYDNDNEDVDDSFFNEMSDYVKKGGTKFGHLQPKRGFNRGNVLQNEFIFVPLQIPHDAVIKYHSDITCDRFVTSLCKWADQQGNPQIVFKGHPINIGSMSSLSNTIGQYRNTLYLKECHIHEMMEKATAVYVINSGTGQEAMLLDKTVAAFGGCEYMGGVIKGDIDDLDKTWDMVKNVNKGEQGRRYRRWYDWYSKNVFDTR